MKDDHLKALLEHLCATLLPERQIEIEERHRRVLLWEKADRLPVVMKYPLPEEGPFQPYPHRAVFDNPEAMLYNELVRAFETSICNHNHVRDDLPFTIRANFGTVVIASLFGAEVEQRGDNPPWINHEKNGALGLEAVLDRDPLDFSRGWCPRVVERYQFYRDMLEDYPELKKTVQVVLPDLQSPLDNLELIVGSNLFTDLIARPAFAAKALRSVAKAQVGFSRRLAVFLSDGPPGFAHQHGVMIKGNALLRDDIAILISPQMYRDLIAPCDRIVLEALGGGGIHSCGKVMRHADCILNCPWVSSFDLGQSELNDMDVLYRKASKNNTPLTRVKATRSELVSGSVMNRFPTGVNLVFQADSRVDAKETMEQYIRATERGGERKERS